MPNSATAGLLALVFAVLLSLLLVAAFRIDAVREAAHGPQARDLPEPYAPPLCRRVIATRDVWVEDGEWREGPTRVVLTYEAPCKPGETL